MLHITLYLLLTISIGCDAGRQQQSSTAPASQIENNEEPSSFADSTSETPEDLSPSQADPGPSCKAIGLQKIPSWPSKAARELNAEALKAHREGRFEESLQGFRKALEESPDYDIVRFNAACSLTKLGRVEEARSELESLLLIDLPTYASRLKTDADLLPLRDDKVLGSFINRVAECYAGPMDSGTQLVAYRSETSRAWAQAGVYLPETRRFIPLSPKVNLRMSGLPDWQLMIAPYFDRESNKTLVLSYLGNDAEDPHLDDVKVRIFSAPLGELEAARRGPRPEDAPFLTVGLDGDQAILGSRDFQLRQVYWSIDGSGMRRARKVSLPETHINAGNTFWVLKRGSPQGYRIAGNRLNTPDGSHELGRGHAALDMHIVRVDLDAGIAVAYSSSSGDCGYPDRYLVDVVNLREGSVSRRLRGQGQIVVDLGADGALYVQTRTELRRYPNPLDDDYEVLPDGLGLSSNPWGFNPYC